MKKTTNYTVLRAVVVALFVILIGRLWYMQVVQVNVYRAEGINSRLILHTVFAPRGIIYDSNGVPLVRNLPNFAVSITPDDWRTSHSVAESRLLSSLLHHRPSAKEIRYLIWKNGVGTQKLPGDPTRPFILKSNLGNKTFVMVKTHSIWLPGVDASVDLTRRRYINGPSAPLAHIIGYTQGITEREFALVGPQSTYRSQHYTQFDQMGQSGIESQDEQYLHGRNGLQTAEINGAAQQVTQWKTARPVIPGDGVRLTIQSNLETNAAQDCSAAMSKLAVSQCAAVVMDVHTGNILAMVSLPSFNNNLFTRTRTKRINRKIVALENNTTTRPLYDLVTQATMPPGSIFKVITATAGLETRVITPSTTIYDVHDYYRCSGCQVIHGWKKGGLGPVNVVGALEKSSDIFFYQVAGGGQVVPGNGLGPYRLARWARLYGLGSATGVGLPGESAGTVASPRLLHLTNPGHPWSWYDSFSMGIGQGATTVTPIQMVTVASAIANGGSLIRPRIVSAVTSPDGKHVLTGKNFGAVPDIERHQFIAPWVDALVRKGMRLGVTEYEGNQEGGTSNWNFDLRTQAAGKTGTADTGIPLCDTCKGNDYVDGWWIGFAPYNDPKIAVCVVIPRAGGDGANTAAPVASKIMDDYFHIKHPLYSHLQNPHGANTWLDYVYPGASG